MNSPDYDDIINIQCTNTYNTFYHQLQGLLHPMKNLKMRFMIRYHPWNCLQFPSHLKDPVDSKPPIVSKSPDPPVKKVDSVIHCSPLSRERRNEERRNKERRPRDPRLYRRPDFRPSYRSQCLAVLCIWNNGFTLTNGVVSYAVDRECPNELFKFLHYLNSTIHLCHRPTLVGQHSWLATDDSTHILFKSIKEDSSRRFTSVDASLQCTMDQIDAFSEHISTTVVPVTLPEKPDALE
ncbi:hypothetical protein TNCV_3100071 [Trichonephila clavipes]|nr:hypothetical protein TNCV_3100071 [Trichonephila clavipes]